MSWLVNRLRFRRLSLSGARTFHQFAIYYGDYSNWKNTPKPVVFIMYSGDRYTHGLAIQYMSSADKAWFARTLYLLRRGNQIMDGRTMYKFIKARRPSIVRDCYRVYFSSLFNGKMIAFGLTDRFKEIYEGIYRDNWIDQLNKNLLPSAMPGTTGPQIAFSSSELMNRVAAAQNSVPITQRSVRRPAPWASGGNTRAPWIK